MNELSLFGKMLWQAPLGWLSASLLCGLCLMLIQQQLPLPYRRPIRNVRWIIIPYLGLIAGGISPRLLGLTGIHWFASFGIGLVLIGGVLFVLVIVRSVIAFSGTSIPAATSLTTRQGNNPPGRYATAFPISLLDIGAEEFHLAFLRSAIWELLLAFPTLSAQANYWAAWVALCLALPEALTYPPTVTQRLCKCTLLVTTTVLFIFTRNLWLSWLLHLLGWMLLAPSAEQEAQSYEQPHSRFTDAGN